jgi:hypothetical protein
LVLSKLRDKESLLEANQYSRIAVVGQRSGTTICVVPNWMMELRFSRFIRPNGGFPAYIIKFFQQSQ